MDGAQRRQAIEAFGKTDERNELWYRKDVTCRIFVVMIISKLTTDHLIIYNL